ncbi:hypothetical protein CBS147321_7970 [Aspergillus niger]|uniref:SNF2 N-terminal domain family protein n=1 Tax=Aspergillus niger TaxID=5061 RepID=A0A254U5M8_ASPNG|nr:hypothetical protein CBS12448_10288 [Aspergillus niger]KAI2874420.1 hypothetical protein CBS11852_10671 [Aspergillus niger]KAI2936718.1 hypothetical protein CBS147322_11058 [Aspergillus niger]KAI2937255.1 hypothetical protein CBS147321_7970 [Aspergillus niger]KAI3015033.1 hypothetical protein CBS147347_11316 [Aspergillus niger]
MCFKVIGISRPTVFQLAQKSPAVATTTQGPATILCDSMSALQVIANSWNKSGQRIIQAIHQSAGELKARGIPLQLQWVPGHCGDPGNNTAGRLAKEAVSLEKKHLSDAFSRARKDTSATKSASSGNRSGGPPQREDTSVRSIKAGYTAHFPGTEPTFSRSCGPATHGSRHTASDTDFKTTHNASVEE